MFNPQLGYKKVIFRIKTQEIQNIYQDNYFQQIFNKQKHKKNYDDMVKEKYEFSMKFNL